MPQYFCRMNFEEDIRQCLQVLKAGGVILYPTDTVWGLGCDATNSDAVEKIFRIKRRDESKSMIVLLADGREVIQYVVEPDLRVFDYLDEAIKPTTVIYEGATGFAQNLIAADGSIAIRVTKDEFCKHLIKRLRKPLVSTSANISGSPAPANFTEITPDILGSVDYVVKYRQEDTRQATPSAIIRWNTDGTVTEIRK